MSTSKHIDVICAIAAVLTLLLTILFMNGRAIGLTVLADEDAGDGQFTANDLRADWADSADNTTQIVLSGDTASVNGNGAYVYGSDIHIVYAGRYIVSGELTDGSLIIDADGDDKIWILMNGASLRCSDGAAMVIEQAEKVFLTLADGTENVIAGWEEADAEEESSASDESGSIDGTIYSRDDLTVNGSGSLTVTSGYRHGIVCNDDLVITGGQLTVTAPQDGLHANDSVRIANADLTIRAGDDGITVSNDEATGYFYMESGSVTIPSCYEGIEAIDVTVCGGDIDISPTDDGINANGYGTSSITVAGGNIRIVNPTGRDADGLDSNGNIYVTGGNLFISMNGSGSNCAIDCGTESGGVCRISGGTVIAAGGSNMAEGFDSSSEQCFIMQTTSADANTEVALRNESGDVLLSGTVPCAFSSIILSAPQLQMGETCTLIIGDTETEVTVDNSSVSAFAFGMRGMPGRQMAQAPDGQMPPELNDESAQALDGQTPPELNDRSAQAPDGQTPPELNDGAAQMPDGGFFGGRRGNRMTDGQMLPELNDGTAQENRQQNRNGSAEIRTVSPAAWLLIGISALCLAAGLLIAARFRH